MKILIRILNIYNEELIRVLIKKTKNGLYTDKGFIPLCDIKYYELIGEVI